jgi:hypothetical protein
MYRSSLSQCGRDCLTMQAASRSYAQTLRLYELPTNPGTHQPLYFIFRFPTRRTRVVETISTLQLLRSKS